MITKVNVNDCGMGDALNARAFITTYCDAKNIKRSSIKLYAIKHWWMFEGMGFTKSLNRYEFVGHNLTPFNNFGFYDLKKTDNSLELDVSIARSAGIDFSYETIVPLPKYDAPQINLPEKFITFNTGYNRMNLNDPNFLCLKEWPLEYWEELISLIDIPCIQIGSGPTCKIAKNSYMNLVNKFTIKQSAEIMRKALFHIDIEGGLSVLNQHLGKKSVVLFGPTAIQNQGRSFNLNISSNTCEPCYEWGIKRKSLYTNKNVVRCNAHCMTDLKPEYVVEQIYKNKWL